jgi:hypothetical protein
MNMNCALVVALNTANDDGVEDCDEYGQEPSHESKEQLRKATMRFCCHRHLNDIKWEGV